MTETKAEKLHENETKETQEVTPEVSANKKEIEVSKNQEKTEINLANLQEDIAKSIETAKDNSTKKKLEQMQKDVEDNKNDQEFLIKKAKELREMQKTDSTWFERNKKNIFNWFAKSSIGAGIVGFFSKIGIDVKEWLGINEEEVANAEKNASTEAEKEIEEKETRNENIDQNLVVETNDEDISSIGSLVANENEPSLHSAEQSEIKAAQQKEEELKKEHSNALWVLSRMIASGYIPSKLYGRRSANRMLETPWDIKVGLMKLIPSMREQLVREKAFLISNGVSSYDYDTYLNKLSAMHQDIKTGKISSFDDLKKHYPDMIQSKPTMIEKLLKSKKSPLKREHKAVQKNIEHLENHENRIRGLDNDMKALEKDVQAKYKELTDLDKAAQKDPAKAKQLRAELDKITNEYNKKATQIYAETGIHMKTATSAEIMRYQRQFGVVDKLVKTNGGVEKLFDKVNGKGGRMMLRVGIAGLVFRGGAEIAQQGILSKETALDVTDLGISVIPFAGGVYDIGMAIRGKDLNGREMGTADRWIRGSVGAGSLVLDVFTAGIGGTVTRALTKSGQATAKAVTTAVKTEKAVSTSAKAVESIYTGVRVATKGLMVGGLCYGVYVNVADIAVATQESGEVIVKEIEAKNTENTTVI